MFGYGQDGGEKRVRSAFGGNSDNEKPAFGGWKNGGGGFGAKKQGGFNELPKGGGFAKKGGGGGGFAKAAFSKGVNGGGGFFAAKKTEVFDDQKRPFGGGFAQTKTLKFGTKLSEKSAPKPNFGKSLFKAAAEPGPAKTKPTTNAKTEWGPMDRGKIEDDPWIGDGSDGVLEVKDKLELDGDRPLFCTDIIVRAGGTLTVKAWNGKTGGELRLRASGSVTVEEGGVIDVSGCGYRGPLADKAVNNYNNAADKQGESIEGVGAKKTENNGSGGGGGIASSSYGSVGAGGGGHGTPGVDGEVNTYSGGNHKGGRGGEESIGGPELTAGLLMGSAGGAGKFYTSAGQETLKGGNGGGALEIAAPRIAIHGKILSDGENGVDGQAQYASGAGGGSGGTILLRAAELILNGVISCVGGTGGKKNAQLDGGQNICSGGGAGGGGRIRFDCDSVTGHGQRLPDGKGISNKHSFFQQPCPPGLCFGINEVREGVALRDLARLRSALDVLPTDIPVSFAEECAAARALNARLEKEAQVEMKVREAIRAGHLPHLRAVLVEANTAFAGDPPPKDCPLDLAITEGNGLVDMRTTWVDRLLEDRLGADKVGPLISGLTDAEYVALQPVVAMANERQCTCAKNHELPLDTRRIVQFLDETLTKCTATAIAERDEAARAVATFEVEKPSLEAQLKFAQDEEAAARAAYEKAKLRLDQATKAEQAKEAEVNNYDSELEKKRTHSKRMMVRREAVSSLSTISESVYVRSASAEGEWKRWLKKLGTPHAVAQLNDDEFTLLMITLGRCHWIKCFAEHKITAKILAGVTDDMLRQVLEGSDRASFGEIREFVLAVQALEGGRGLFPKIAESDGETNRPLEEWSFEAVAKHFESLNMKVAADRCRNLQINGRVLLSISRDDIFRHLALPGGVEGALAFETAVSELRGWTAKVGPDPRSVASHNVTDERLSVTMVEALAGGGQPAEFPLEYIRRCTHDFSDAHLIGEGTYARVYRAVDTVSGLRFAVKRVCHEKLASSPDRHTAAEQSMRHEFELLRTVRHPHMIRLLGYCFPSASSSELCLAYELGVYGSVADMLTDDSSATSFGVKARVRALAALASVLNYMHRSHDPSVYHRDVKCANLVLGQGMDVKLIDCGLSRVLTSEQASEQAAGKNAFTVAHAAGAVRGTPGYMCPRYIVTGKYGEQSEIFSFGVVIMELLTGKVSSAVEGGLYGYFIDPVNQECELTGETADPRAGEWPPALLNELIRIAKMCVGNFKRRPTMQTVLAELKILERDYGALTADEIYHRMAVKLAEVKEHNEALVKAQQKALEEKYLAQVHEHNKAEAAQRVCCICYDALLSSDGVDCGATSGEGAPHFTCHACFEKHVLTECEKDLADVRARNGQIFCPLAKHGCQSKEPFAESVVAVNAAGAVFGAYLRAQSMLQEELLVSEFDKRLASERDRLLTMGESDQKVERARHTIIDTILTLKCPSCDTTFMDFDGSYALKCHHCGCGFCAFCLSNCGTDAEGHVATCKFKVSGTYGKDLKGFNLAQKQRRERMIRNYLTGLDVEVRDKIVVACKKVFTDFELDVDTILSGKSQTGKGLTAKR